MYRTASLRFSVTELMLADTRLPSGHLARSSLSLGHDNSMSSVLCCPTLGMPTSCINLRIIQPLSSVDSDTQEFSI